MKRYLLFGGNQYYPRGGAWDFVESHDTIDDAEAAGDKMIGAHSQMWATIAVIDGDAMRTVRYRNSGLPWYDPRDDDDTP